MQDLNRITKWLFCLLFISSINISWGQNYLSANVENLTWANNPASIGELEQFNGRMIVSYRSQWTEDSPFRDIFAAYQYRFEGLTIGGKILREDAGGASLARTKLVADIAYQKTLNHDGDMISAGISGGMLQNRLSPGTLKFDSQYADGVGYNSQVESGEALLNTDRLRPAFDAGLSFRKYFYASDITIGLSVQNIHSFTAGSATNTSIQPIIYTAYARYLIEFHEGFSAEVFGSYQRFANLHAPLLLLRSRYQINDEYECIFGVGKRLHNTVVGQAGLKWRNVEVFLNVDIANTQLPMSASVIELGGAYQFKLDN